MVVAEKLELTKSELQQIVDEHYPSSMRFDIDTLAPHTELEERANLIPHNFKSGEHLLDIGCAKGWFSLTFAKDFERVTAIEPDIELYACAETLSKDIDNMNVSLESFMSFETFEKYDRILLGNVAHYIHTEFGNFDWVKKLADMSTGLVLIEGPRIMDRNIMLPDFLNFEKEMAKYFTLLVMNSANFLPGRYVMLWQRRYQ